MTAGSEGSQYAAKTSSKQSGRRRVLIQHYSDKEEEEEEETTILPPNQQMVFKAQATHFHDLDVDMQLTDVTPEHGGSSLQLSTSLDEYVAGPNQAVTSLSRLDITNLADATPPPNTRKEPTSDTQSAKQRRSEAGRHTTHTGMSIPSSIKSKENVPSIDIVSYMWLGFSIHEAIAIQKGENIICENRTSEEFTHLGIPHSEVIELQTLRRAFPRVPQLTTQVRGPMRYPATISTSLNYRAKRKSTPPPASPKASKLQFVTILASKV